MKKIIALFCALCAAVSFNTVAFAAEDIYCADAEAVEVSGKAENTDEEYIAISVLDQSTEIQAKWEDIRSGVQSKDLIVYFDAAALGDDGSYSFSFVPGKSGLFECVLTNFEGKQTESFNIEFVDTDDRAVANTAIEAAEDETTKDDALTAIKNSLSTYRYDFGVFGDIYEEADADDVAELVYGYLKDTDKEEIPTVDAGGVISRVVRHSYLVSLINDGASVDLEENITALDLENMGLADFYDSRYADAISQKLCDAEYESTDEFATAVMEVITGITIQYNNGTDDISDILLYCADVSGINTSKVSDTLCQAIAGRGDMYSFAALDKYIDDYTPPKQNGSKDEGNKNTNGGFFGGTTGSGIANMTDVTISTEKTEEEATEADCLFSDVPEGHWARAMIEALYTKGVVSGKGLGIFCPEDNITREEFVKLLVTAMNLNTVGDELTFDDVSKEDWFYNYVYTAYNSGIINGISANAFGSGQPITRQDLAVMAYNTIKVCDLEISGAADSSFKDAASIADYAAEAVAALKGEGILSGDDTGNFRPNDNTTRAEAVKIIYMLIALK